MGKLVVPDNSQPYAIPPEIAEDLNLPVPPPELRALRAIAILLVVVLAAYFIVPEAGKISNLNLHAITEIGIGLIGLLTGFSIVLRFHAMGKRFHLFLGLAFFVNGVADLIHGGLCLMPDVFDLSGDLSPRLFILQSYRASQLMMGLTLAAALVLPALLGKQKSPLRETLSVSLIVLALTAFSAMIQSLGAVNSVDSRRNAGVQPSMNQPAPTVSNTSFSIVNTDLPAATLLLIVGAVFLWRYFRQADMLIWWIALSALANFLSQIAMIRHSDPFDRAFCLAHLYKFLGYLLPLFGFGMYQIAVILQYERIQRQLIDAREQALSATRAKSEFLANISHEIRTPMNAILGMTRQVLRDTLSDAQRERLEDVQSSAKSLLLLLNEILDFSKLEAGKAVLDLSVFRLHDCVIEAAKSLAVTAQEKHLNLDLKLPEAEPDRLFGDAGRLRQILVNLLSNAIKFTDVGGVTLAVERKGQVGDLVEFEFIVRDTGIGIPKEKQADIFHAFEQADGSTTREYGGTGLGLTIATKLVELLNGRIWVESEVGQGSAFHFTASFRVVGDDVDESKSTEYDLKLPHTNVPRRIIVAEDNLINQRLAQGLLAEMGHNVLLANNGQEAIDLLDEREVHLILMDLQMPLLGGMEATSIIRERERGSGKRMPIIALTADILPLGRDKCLEAGMDEYLAKPLDERELFSAIERHALMPATPVALLAGTSNSDVANQTSAKLASSSRSRDGSERKILNRDRLMKQVGHDVDLLRELIELFEAQSQELLAALSDAAAQGGLARMGPLAHKLSGSLASLQAERSLDACRRIEDRDITIAQACDALAQLQRELELLRPELSAIV